MNMSYLLKGNKEQELAYLEGCYAMMEVFSHSAPEDIPALCSRRGYEWILYLCQMEVDRSRAQQARIGSAILRNYSYNRAEVRGMILDCECVDDNGNPVKDDGTPCAPHSYPYRYFVNKECNRLSYEEYQKLSPDEQAACDEEIYLNLKCNLSNGRTMTINLYRKDIIETILIDTLLNEPESVLQCYWDTLKKVNSGEDYNHCLQHYGELIKQLLLSRGVGKDENEKAFEESDNYEE